MYQVFNLPCVKMKEILINPKTFRCRAEDIINTLTKFVMSFTKLRNRWKILPALETRVQLPQRLFLILHLIKSETPVDELSRQFVSKGADKTALNARRRNNSSPSRRCPFRSQIPTCRPNFGGTVGTTDANATSQVVIEELKMQIPV